MERVLELISSISTSETVTTKNRRVHAMMRYLMKTMDSSWEITGLLQDKVDQWKYEGMSRKKIKEYKTFLDSV
jgi:hypothetical protein